MLSSEVLYTILLQGRILVIQLYLFIGSCNVTIDSTLDFGLLLMKGDSFLCIGTWIPIQVVIRIARDLSWTMFSYLVQHMFLNVERRFNPWYKICHGRRHERNFLFCLLIRTDIGLESWSYRDLVEDDVRSWKILWLTVSSIFLLI